MDDLLEATVAERLGGARVVLAVSGGRDSMTLLHAARSSARGSVACVATYDHGTGTHASAAAALVERAAIAAGLIFAHARATHVASTEAEWRAQRWTFLRTVAREHGAQVATAHTLDDQIETVFLRTVRGSGARGLAALAAPSAVVRPLLGVTRALVSDYASRERIEWIDDPSNAALDHARNRARLELLPALERVHPGLSNELAAIGLRAAALRIDVERYVDRELAPIPHDGGILVARAPLLRYDAKALALLWPAVAARAGVTLDRRGTARLVEFTKEAQNGARMPLSGNAEVIAHRELFWLRTRSSHGSSEAVGLATGVRVGAFQFEAREQRVATLWSAALPSESRLTVRSWLPGDRMVPAGGDARRVKGLLRDAGIDSASRPEWPVVLMDDEIVWIPGVRRSSAASVRSGRPVVTYHCERIDR